MTGNAPKWPVVGEVAGIEVVTIPRAVYEGLLERSLKTQLDRAAKRASRLDKDGEIALFVDACLERNLTYAEIRAACMKHFGNARTPSRSALSRWFRRRLVLPSKSSTIPANPGIPSAK